MMISEYSFPWLYEAEVERLTEELERRRMQAERQQADGASAVPQAAPRGGRTPSPRARHGAHRAARRMSAAGGTM
ncbi:hypothetical protein [Herbiconiux sp. A18JL235]|uniref:Uncharacterized protein n=1 Tax=Herbiconiux sp. A18JL235 TaxID=3152363 RepID=A0AB39BBU0_9MICO